MIGVDMWLGDVLGVSVYVRLSDEKVVEMWLCMEKRDEEMLKLLDGLVVEVFGDDVLHKFEVWSMLVVRFTGLKLFDFLDKFKVLRDELVLRVVWR